jgi:REP element-mobilizing transposase RayT
MLVMIPKYRRSDLLPEIQNDLYREIRGIAQRKGAFVVAVNGTEDHIHILLRINPTHSVSNLVRDIKANSSRFISEHPSFPGIFRWQRGYSALTYGERQISDLIKYIKHQKSHHGIEIDEHK